MNTFLQRVLRKNSNEELNVANGAEKGRQKGNEARSSGPTKGNWIKKLGNYSPHKYQVTSGQTKTNAMKALDRSELCDTYDASTPQRTSVTPQTPPVMPDLESIIREFELGFLSPTKHDGASVHGNSKEKNFVKKIVAAFEVKYKTYDDLKTAQENQKEQEESKQEAILPEARSKGFGIFSSPFKSSSVDSSPSKQDQDTVDGVTVSPSTPNSNSEATKKEFGIFDSSLENLNDEDGDLDNFSKPLEGKTKNENRRSGIFYVESKDRSVDSKSSKKSSIFSSPFNRRSSKDKSISSEIGTSPTNLERQDSKDSSSDYSSLFTLDKTDSKGRSNFHLDLLNASSLDDTKAVEDINLDVTLPDTDEANFMAGNALPKTSTMINEAGEVPRVDKTPKIVGAFLKKPIEVEDTSIDWIPITGKKLPRKRSLKKLLFSFTGKKLERKNKLFSSERNLNEESRELQDSGYDERSCSSSSLTSLISIADALLQQENSYVEPERRTTLRTFGSRNSLDDELDEAFCDAYRTSRNPDKKQLHLTEVPREEVKLDLGPSYPSPDMVTKSLDRRSTSKKARDSPSAHEPLDKLPKHPHVSGIPKHPFVSLTKMDEPQEFHNSDECRGSQEPPRVIKNNLYEVEFHRSCDDTCFSASCRDSSSTASNYDVPRKFISKSNNELSSYCQPTVTRRNSEPIYDVPNRPLERPKSTGYEEVRSSKRNGLVDFSAYKVPCNLVPHYATIKPRNIRVCYSSEALRFLNDFTSTEKRSVY
ncbi:uncharacterized protein LOC143426395 [Xylocopa sonorina]|uniref:uncharacterized protein LOC143426395 n=1 Tax=Xylocopa sonorina TaxID=1818115 RepID=UPI00403B0312